MLLPITLLLLLLAISY